MTPAQRQQLAAHVEEVAKLLYEDAIEQGMSLGSLRDRADRLQPGPEGGDFFVNCCAGEDAGSTRKLVSILDVLQLGSQQAQRLGVKPQVQQSPYLELCCLSQCAKGSYQKAKQDVEQVTGVRVSANTQQRIAQTWPGCVVRGRFTSPGLVRDHLR